MTAVKRSGRDAAIGDPADAAPFFASSLEHLLTELRRVELKIRAHVSHSRKATESEEAFEGLFISELEIDSLLNRSFGVTERDQWRSETLESVEKHGPPSAREQEIVARKTESQRRAIELRLDTLAQRFQLTPFDVDVLLICLVPEIDLRYERIYAYIQDDVTKRRPSVDLVLNLLCDSLEERITARYRFSHAAPLFQHHFVLLIEDPPGSVPPLLGRFLKVDERVVGYLLGSDVVDDRIRHYTRKARTDAARDELSLSGETKDRLSRFAATATTGEVDRIFYFQGPHGIGKRATAAVLCDGYHHPLLEIDGASLLVAPELDFPLAVDLIEREARLQNAALYWTGFDRLLADDMAARLDYLLKMLRARCGLTILAGDVGWEPHERLRGKVFIRLELPRPEYAERMALWARALVDMPHEVDLDLGLLAGQFRLTGGQIADTVFRAQSLAIWRCPETPVVAADDLRIAARLSSNQKLAALTQKIVPRYDWNDIILPPARLRQLHDILHAAQQSPIVYGEWGFGDKLSLGKGLSVLFSGPSGTGKTMAGEIIAGTLGLDLYKIDLSAVVSKYIGETEKNLSRIFSEAETANAILFFDEADALFGKRSEVRDAHDRYANIETGYLLQRMEAYEGLVILATNLSKNIDEAFVRRLHFIVEFPFPSAADRQRIWEGLWPEATPRDPRLDFGLMAARFEMSGGNIKNVALAASFLAAADGGVVRLNHLLRATEREYQKMGKVIGETDFEHDSLAAKPS